MHVNHGLQEQKRHARASIYRVPCNAKERRKAAELQAANQLLQRHLVETTNSFREALQLVESLMGGELLLMPMHSAVDAFCGWLWLVESVRFLVLAWKVPFAVGLTRALIKISTQWYTTVFPFNWGVSESHSVCPYTMQMCVFALQLRIL